MRARVNEGVSMRTCPCGRVSMRVCVNKDVSMRSCR